jgi:hypothetical protein
MSASSPQEKREPASSKAGAAPEHAPIPGVRHEVWLTKEGRVRKSWKLRHFRIESGRLVYAAAQGAAEKGAVFLTDALVDAEADVAPTAFSSEASAPADAAAQTYAHHITVTAAGGRVLRLAAPSEQVRAEVIAALRDAAAFENYLALCHARRIAPIPAVVAAGRAGTGGTLRIADVALAGGDVDTLAVLLAGVTALRTVEIARCGLDDTQCAALLSALGTGTCTSGRVSWPCFFFFFFSSI